VDYASYLSDHPDSEKRRLYIRVKKGKPEDLLKKAIKQLEDEINAFSKDFEAKSKRNK
jgi:DNA-directed RNA polymerase subunit L